MLSPSYSTTGRPAARGDSDLLGEDALAFFGRIAWPSHPPYVPTYYQPAENTEGDGDKSVDDIAFNYKNGHRGADSSERYPWRGPWPKLRLF